MKDILFSIVLTLAPSLAIAQTADPATLRHGTASYQASFKGGDVPLTLHFQDKGKPLPWGPLSLQIQMHEVTGTKHKLIGCRELVTPLRMVGDNILWHAKMNNDVELIIAFRLLDDGVTYSYCLKKPSTALPEIAARINVLFPRIATPVTKGESIYHLPAREATVTLEELPTLLKDYRINYKTYKSKSGKFSLDETPEGHLGEMQEASVRMPFTSKEIQLDGPKKLEDGVLEFWTYAGGIASATEGFSLRCRSVNLEKSPGPEFTLRFK